MYSSFIYKFIVFLNCKSLWIKVSAKWLNVNEDSDDFLRPISDQQSLRVTFW